MARKLELSDFEKQVLVLLIGKTISPVVKALLEQADNSQGMQAYEGLLTVKTILTIFCASFKEQVTHDK